MKIDLHDLVTKPKNLKTYGKYIDPEVSWMRVSGYTKTKPTDKDYSIISKNPEYACRYAANILRARWPQGEEAILTSQRYAAQYALQVIRNPWPEAEHYFTQSHDLALNYAMKCIKERWEPGEGAIATDAQSSLVYAHTVLKQRFELGEEAISKSKDHCLWYFRNVLHNKIDPNAKGAHKDILDSVMNTSILDYT